MLTGKPVLDVGRFGEKEDERIIPLFTDNPADFIARAKTLMRVQLKEIDGINRISRFNSVMATGSTCIFKYWAGLVVILLDMVWFSKCGSEQVCWPAWEGIVPSMSFPIIFGDIAVAGRNSPVWLFAPCWGANVIRCALFKKSLSWCPSVVRVNIFLGVWPVSKYSTSN